MEKSFHFFMLVIPYFGLHLASADVARHPMWLDDFHMLILHTNDLESKYEQFNNDGGECTQEQSDEGQCFGGVARHKSMVMYFIFSFHFSLFDFIHLFLSFYILQKKNFFVTLWSISRRLSGCYFVTEK